MSVFRHVDRDKLVGYMAFYWWVPLRYWQFGIPEEPFFLHEVFRRSNLHREPWDIGLRSPALIRHRIARLHQQGANRTDKFGSDFALTVDIQGRFTMRKTALFQTKVSNNYSATIERSQLDEVLSVREFVGRSFAMAVDRLRGVIRIQSADLLASGFSRSQATKTFDTIEWVPSSDWIVRWFECDIGRPSNDFEPSPEGLLAAYVTDLPEGFPRYEPSRQRPEEEHIFIPEVWHHITVKISENASPAS